MLSRAAALADPAIVGDVASLVREAPKQVKEALADSQYSQYEPVPVLDPAPLSLVESSRTTSRSSPVSPCSQ